MNDSARLLRRLVARVRHWNLPWVAAAAVLFVGAIAVGSTGEAAAAVYLALVATTLTLVAHRRRPRRRVYDPDEVEGEIRLAMTKLLADVGWITPEMLSEHEAVETAARRLNDRRFPIDRLIALSHDPDVYLACAALSAVARRSDVPAAWTNTAIRELRGTSHHKKLFLMQALASRASYPIIPSILTQLDEDVPHGWIAQLIERRLASGERVELEALRKNVPWRLAPVVESFLDDAPGTVADQLRDVVSIWIEEVESGLVKETEDVVVDSTDETSQLTADDLEFLRGIGRVAFQPLNRVPPFLAPEREQLVERIIAAISSSPRRSVLLVGEHGVGKTMLGRAAIDRLPKQWVSFEAGAAAVHAGAIYVGELETRADDLSRRLRHRRVIWFFPELENALYAGQHSRSPRGLLDALLPYLERRELTVIAEVTPESYARLVAGRPRIASVFEVLRVHPTDVKETQSVAQHVLRSKWNLQVSPAALGEAFDLAEHFAPNAAPPANVLRLVETAAAELCSHGAPKELSVSDIVRALSHGSGMPLTLLDPATPLDVDAVRAFFEARVLGQRDAVDCIVDRIALIKAGLTDPTRPLGVFLFVGPTGTGKTELAKATAEFVFGSADRLVRMDMSEFQTLDSVERLLSDTSRSGYGASLVSAVRENPFSVVLLDEFEKAAVPIWDAFLQVFDAGRLTDHQGRVVDFRRCIIIMTSNIGSAIPRVGPLGFGRTRDTFRAEVVRSAVEASFRPEFVNRLDQIVVFSPLGRDQMRALLDKELAAILDRRGLRSRPWAVIFDDSAIDFLIEAGFSADLGARPLKRAVETHLLAPLAKAIVQQHVPEGDQFLFVTATNGSGVTVKFIDPDDEETEVRGFQADADELAAELDLRALARSPSGDDRSARFLMQELARLAASVREDMPEAVDDGYRFERLAAALGTAKKLGDRLARQLDKRNGMANELVQLLATRLYVLDRALVGWTEQRPENVFLRVSPTPGAPLLAAHSCVDRLREMYQGWAARRGMRVLPLAADAGSSAFAVAGLGAGEILADEAGLHVFEQFGEESRGSPHVARVAVRVRVATWTPSAADAFVPLDVLAARAFAGEPAEDEKIVRQYRFGQSPFVRDATRGYRTGKLDRVLVGDFDLF